MPLTPPSAWQPWIDLGVGALVVLTIGVTLLAAFLLWRNGYSRGWLAARSTPPTCPGCGYNLSGLTRCRCPECGVEYRLEELWRKQARSTKSADGKPNHGVPPTEVRSGNPN